MESKLYIVGDIYAEFVNNKGNDGGAMSFYKQSIIANKYNKASANFILRNNHAYGRGGAIFVGDYFF